jgi:hypothetical protein
MTWSHCARRCPTVWFGALLFLPALAGCGQQTGQLSGTVTYQGQPLPGGRVTFRPADPRRNAVTVPINKDGSYEASVPTGEVQISVDNRELQPPPPRGAGPGPAGLPPGITLPPGVKMPSPAAQDTGKGATTEVRSNAPQKAAGRYVPIPANYYSVETSGLKHTVKSGPETFNIEMP